MDTPPIPLVLMRGEWSLGKVLGVYWKHSMVGNTYLGRELMGGRGESYVYVVCCAFGRYITIIWQISAISADSRHASRYSGHVSRSVDICHVIWYLQIEETGKEFIASHFCFVRNKTVSKSLVKISTIFAHVVVTKHVWPYFQSRFPPKKFRTCFFLVLHGVAFDSFLELGWALVVWDVHFWSNSYAAKATNEYF